MKKQFRNTCHAALLAAAGTAALMAGVSGAMAQQCAQLPITVPGVVPLPNALPAFGSGLAAANAISARKESALAKKADAAPHQPIHKPASDGPTRREP